MIVPPEKNLKIAKIDEIAKIPKNDIDYDYESFWRGANSASAPCKIAELAKIAKFSKIVKIPIFVQSNITDVI